MQVADAINANLAQYGRGFQPRSVQGFAAMEQGDWDRAGYFWQEAARNGYTPLQLGWLLLLEGRAMEVQGDVQRAMALYRQARSECSRWEEPVYRHAVCMVKLGFTDKAMSDFLDLVYNAPNMFNRILLDPELERGRIHILSALWGAWSDAKQARDDKLETVAGLPDYLKSWFRTFLGIKDECMILITGELVRSYHKSFHADFCHEREEEARIYKSGCALSACSVDGLDFEYRRATARFGNRSVSFSSHYYQLSINLTNCWIDQRVSAPSRIEATSSAVDSTICRRTSTA